MPTDESGAREHHHTILENLKKLVTQNALNIALFFGIWFAGLLVAGLVTPTYEGASTAIVISSMVVALLFTPRQSIDGRPIGIRLSGAGYRALRRLL